MQLNISTNKLHKLKRNLAFALHYFTSFCPILFLPMAVLLKQYRRLLLVFLLSLVVVLCPVRARPLAPDYPRHGTVIRSSPGLEETGTQLAEATLKHLNLQLLGISKEGPSGSGSGH
ncbi:conserved hypothetical protein [Ricinus communis]|uniref:Uncharacterized protein n=1 Tax=Ricinus communis TaxID=3988 RepID=B9RUB9_RICCO|nr:conserved hypothetical protein [Ricinus communis]